MTRTYNGKAEPMPGTVRFRSIPAKEFTAMIAHHPLWARIQLWKARRLGCSKAHLEHFSRLIEPDNGDGPSMSEIGRKRHKGGR